MMADAWRDLNSEEKKEYSVPEECSSGGADDEESELTLQDAKELAMRVAKRHEGDVCYYAATSTFIDTLPYLAFCITMRLHLQANLLHYIG